MSQTTDSLRTRLPDSLTARPGRAAGCRLRRRRWPTFEALEIRQTSSRETITEIPLPAVNSAPQQITAGTNGNVWFTDPGTNQVGKINVVTGAIAEYALPTLDSGPYGITEGPDGNIWFTERNVDRIAKIDPSTAAITEYAVPTPASSPSQITFGSDGNVWFTETAANQLGEMNLAMGKITEHATAASFRTAHQTSRSDPTGNSGSPMSLLRRSVRSSLRRARCRSIPSRATGHSRPSSRDPTGIFGSRTKPRSSTSAQSLRDGGDQRRKRSSACLAREFGNRRDDGRTGRPALALPIDPEIRSLPSIRVRVRLALTVRHSMATHCPRSPTDPTAISGSSHRARGLSASSR